jgi:hypothetical protein
MCVTIKENYVNFIIKSVILEVNVEQGKKIQNKTKLNKRRVVRMNK